MATDRHRIGSDRLSANIAAHGAELVELAEAGAGPLLWHGGPEWRRHAPVLFPIVGRLGDDTLIHQGKAHRLTQHGFARDSLFEWIERTDRRAVLRLVESEATLAAYPFRFALTMTYEIDGSSLAVTARIANPAETVLPCAIGAHPAFRWPLAEGAAQESHRLVFEKHEPGPALTVSDGLLGEAMPLPFDGRVLPLSPALFANDALVLRDVASRSVRFTAEDAQGATIRALTVAWSGYKDLGIWSKPSGADFLCIEPWFGTSSPLGWQGEFTRKPGILLLPAGEAREFSWTLSV